jgi:uncharacterized protein (DUF1800 family)
MLATQPRRSDSVGSLKPIRPSAFGYDQARHLLWRAGFGGTPSQIHTLAAWGPEKAVEYLLNTKTIPDGPVRPDDFDADIIRPATPEERALFRAARRSGDEDALARLRLRRQEIRRDDRRQMQQIQHWWLKRLIETPRPLVEKMTVFWHGHFATSHRTIENSYHMFRQNQLFRQHAVGSYADLLGQIIRDPAMIAYLDNNDSRKGHPNENLAREIMELFSLGVGNYTEDDIKEGARALTGYTFRDDEFVFERRNHDEGAKRIFGAAGNFDGEDFVGLILKQPACSAYMTRKLYRFFVADLPESERDMDPATRRIVSQLAGTFRSSGYNVKPLLRRLFLSEHFYSDHIVRQQIKSPVQLVVGAIRSLGTPTRDLSILADAMDLMGQRLFFPPSVKGWDGGRSWINTSTLYVRQNIMAFLLTGKRVQGYDVTADIEKYDPEPLLDALAQVDPSATRDPAHVVEYLLRFAIGHAPAGAQDTLVRFIDDHGGAITPDVITGVLLLITAMPEYQLC